MRVNVSLCQFSGDTLGARKALLGGGSLHAEGGLHRGKDCIGISSYGFSLVGS